MQRASTPPARLFLIFLRLGLTSFGGPVAHLGYFREAFVVRRGWFSERAYADLVALCQFLPGPASSQAGLAIGYMRGGWKGALAAWAGFTLPSAVALILLAKGIGDGAGLSPGVLQGLKLVAVAVVAQAVWGMARSLCPDAPRLTLMVAAACGALLLPGAGGQLGVILLAALAGLWLFAPDSPGAEDGPLPLPLPLSRRKGAYALLAFIVLLLGLPLLADVSSSTALQQVAAFYRAGSLVFGGGHVVLPLLEASVVPPGWVGEDVFLAGYGAAQAVPGPLFTFAAFLGASMQAGPGGWAGGLLCLAAIFLPSFLLVAGALPFWEGLRRAPRALAALMGVNAGVVGLLLAALYDPVWTSTVKEPRDFALALVAFLALTVWRLPPWAVVAGAGLGGWAFSAAV